MFRVGKGLGDAIYCDDNIWGKLAYIAMDVERAAGLFTAMAGPFAGRVGGGNAGRVVKATPNGKAFPNRPLPRDIHGNPIPETSAPHTQLGMKSGRNGSYPQAREFDGNGKPVRDIDFTNHGRSDHSNPHQHRYLPNETGGTPKRSPQEPVQYP